MDSAVREISSSAPAQTLVEPRVKPPKAIATPTIACRRVPLASVARFILSLIIFIALPDSCVQPSPHHNIARKYIQHNMQTSLLRRYFGIAEHLVELGTHQEFTTQNNCIDLLRIRDVGQRISGEQNEISRVAGLDTPPSDNCRAVRHFGNTSH